MPSQCSHGIIRVSSWHWHNSVMMLAQLLHDVSTVVSWCWHGGVMVRQKSQNATDRIIYVHSSQQSQGLTKLEPFQNRNSSQSHTKCSLVYACFRKCDHSFDDVTLQPAQPRIPKAGSTSKPEFLHKAMQTVVYDCSRTRGDHIFYVLPV